MRILTESKIEMIILNEGHCKFFVKYALAPGGTLADDMMRTDVCVFAAQEDLETMQAFAQVMKLYIFISVSYNTIDLTNV